MNKIKIAEIFYSIQGEGLYAGTPSVFLRSFGCNFQCRGFGLATGERSTEPEDVAKKINLYKEDCLAGWIARYLKAGKMAVLY